MCNQILKKKRVTRLTTRCIKSEHKIYCINWHMSNNQLSPKTQRVSSKHKCRFSRGNKTWWVKEREKQIAGYSQVTRCVSNFDVVWERDNSVAVMGRYEFETKGKAFNMKVRNSADFRHVCPKTISTSKFIYEVYSLLFFFYFSKLWFAWLLVTYSCGFFFFFSLFVIKVVFCFIIILNYSDCGCGFQGTFGLKLSNIKFIMQHWMRNLKRIHCGFSFH